MRVPISWLKDYVQIDLTVEELARKLTLVGLEVKEIQYVGWPMPDQAARGLHARWAHDFKVTGISWDREKIVVGEIRQVMQHPNADRLVLCRLFDGRNEHTVLTGAPNLFEYKGTGPLVKPLKVAYAREGAQIYDGHAEGQVVVTLKRTKIRGVDSYSMACSEKELGISDDHEGIIILDDDAPVGTSLVEYMGDAVLEIEITPNMARNANMLGVAREVSALTGKALKKVKTGKPAAAGPSIDGLASIAITDPALNPRFLLGLIRGVTIRPSPYWVQRRLTLAGMRPINNIVDATNYTMLELGEPLHAFDYDVLEARAKGRPIKIITRTAKAGEKLVTLDGVERDLQPDQVLVCDQTGALSIAGVMGGVESEIYDASLEVLDLTGVDALGKKESKKGKISQRSESTTNILLEAAAWNFINIRRTANAHDLHSEASFRFSRGVHPALAEAGLKRCLYWMAEWSGGKVAPGTIDNYPLPPQDPLVTISVQDVHRLLGIQLTAQEITGLLGGLEFKCEVRGSNLSVQVPPFRMDIGTGVVGQADVIEEIARIYGYENIPETRLHDALPPQRGNPDLQREEAVRDLCVNLGLTETVNYRMTSPERETRLYASGEAPEIAYVTITNPITADRRVLRRTLLAGLLEVVERNARWRDSQSYFEVGPVFLPRAQELPDEKRRLSVAITGRRQEPAWDVDAESRYDFFDLKGLIEALMKNLHLSATYVAAESPTFHPGRCAEVRLNGQVLGLMGELHPLVQANYDVQSPILAADFDLDAILSASPESYSVRPVSEYPPLLEDIAVVVDESVPAARVEALIWQAGGQLLAGVRLFDVYRGGQIGADRKSLAYSLTYQSFDKTLTDTDASEIRNRIVKRLGQELGAQLRG